MESRNRVNKENRKLHNSRKSRNQRKVTKCGLLSHAGPRKQLAFN